LFGASGEHYWRLARGLDERRVVPDRESKSISHETTFAEDIADGEILHAWLVDLAEQVARRLRRREIHGRTVELKVRFADFKTITRSVTLPQPTNVTQELLAAGTQLLTTRLPKDHLSVRLLGFGVSGLERPHLLQQPLFSDPLHERRQQLDRVTDQIAEKFGRKAIRRSTGLEKEAE
jgi:DNA polymerase-4